MGPLATEPTVIGTLSATNKQPAIKAGCLLARFTTAS
jgi:hypothetical protein